MNNVAKQMPQKSAEITINRTTLWRLETVGDLDSAEIQIYYPVTEDGLPDPSRKVKYCSIMEIRWGGQLGKMRFEIPAASLKEALDNFQAAGDAFATATLERLEAERVREILTSGGTIGTGRSRSN